MARRGRCLIFFLLSIALLFAFSVQSEERATVWNKDPGFDWIPFDTGNLQNGCFLYAPQADRSWGAEAAVFAGASDHAISAARFCSSGQDAYLYGRNIKSDTAWGFVRYTQGDIMGGSFCGPQLFAKPQPEILANQRLVLEFDLFLDQARLLKQHNSWVMVAVNIWFTSSAFPSGIDCTGHKPLVLDLYVHHQSSMAPSPQAHESEKAFHFPWKLSPAIEGRWKSWHIDLTDIVTRALQHDFPSFVERELRKQERPKYRDLELRQLDMVLELVNAEAAATIDNLRLHLLPDKHMGFLPFTDEIGDRP